MPANPVLARLVDEEDPQSVRGRDKVEVRRDPSRPKDFLDRGDVREEAAVGCVSCTSREEARPGGDAHSEGEGDGHGGEKIVVVGLLP